MAIESGGRAMARALAAFLRNLKDEDVLAIESGAARIVVERRVSDSRRRPSSRISEPVDYELIRARLTKSQTREEGLAVLSELAPHRLHLDGLARSLDLPRRKSDNVDRLKDRIVDATIGYRLRSDAIRSADFNARG